MTTMSKKWQLGRRKAQELAEKIVRRFPEVEVEVTDWVELSGSKGSTLRARGFPSPHLDAAAYVLIEGSPDDVEQAATLADNEVSDIWEGSGVFIEHRVTNVIFCKKSGKLEAKAIGPDEELTGPVLHLLEHTQGITFMCFVTKPHEHDFGRLQGKYREAS